MKHSISTQITIQASPEKVWNILMDYEEYPNWNPFVSKIEGGQKEKQRLKVQLPGMKFKPTIVKSVQNEKFEWLGHLLFKGLFDGNHCFHIEKIDNQSCKFIHQEHFSGILVKMFLKKLNGETLDGFKAMNEALKKRAETKKQAE